MKIPKARKLPSGTWRIQLRLGGKSINVTARSEKECLRQAQLIKAEYLSGKRQAPEEAKESPKALPTLGEAIDDYIKDRAVALSPVTLRGYDGIRKHRFVQLMDRPLQELGPEDYKTAVRAESALCGPKTLRNAWGLVRSAVKEATGEEPPKVALPTVPVNSKAFLDADEIKKFVAHIKGHRYEIPMLLALSSLRQSEIGGLTWDHVDLKRRRILIKGAVVPDRDNKYVAKPTNKNKTSTRYVPILMDQLQDALTAAMQPAGRVCSYHPTTLSKWATRLSAEAGVTPVDMHGLRHSFASLAYSLQIPEKVTMEIGGWGDYNTMRKIYTHIGQADMTRYTNQLTTFFNGKTEENAHENAHGDDEALPPNTF